MRRGVILVSRIIRKCPTVFILILLLISFSIVLYFQGRYFALEKTEPENLNDLHTTSSTIIRVKPDGNDNNDGSTWALAKRTIGAALALTDGTPYEIWIKEGIYNEYNLDIIADNLALYGRFAGDESSLEQRHGTDTVIDGQSSGRVIKVSEKSNILFDRLTIRNGKTWGYGSGGGIDIHSSESVTIQNVIVEDSQAGTNGPGGCVSIASNGPIILTDVTLRRCSTAGKGGGLRAVGANIEFTKVTIEDNTAARGGGMALEGGDGFVTQSIFRNNKATSANTEGGGALWLNGVQSVDIKRNFFYQNEAVYGSAIDAYNRTSNQFKNNIFTENQSDYGTILVRSEGTSPSFYNNVLSDNHANLGPPGVYTIDNSKSARFRFNIYSYNTGPMEVFGWDETTRSYSNIAYETFWLNENGPFEHDPNYTYGGGTVFDRDPYFMSRYFTDDPLSFQHTPESISTVVDLADDLLEDFLGAPRPINAKGVPTNPQDRGAFEYQIAYGSGVNPQHLTMESYKGAGGDGDQSNRKLHIVIKDGSEEEIYNDNVPQSHDGFYVLRGYNGEFAEGTGPFDIYISAPGYLVKHFYVSSMPAYNNVGDAGIVTLPRGDANGDNIVDLIDLNKVLTNFAGSDPNNPGIDINGDGIIDLLDLNAVLSNFGKVGDE